MQNFNEGTPHGPHSPEDGLSPLDREILEFFEEMEMKYGLYGPDLPWAVTGALVRYLNRNLHPVDTAEFCEKAGSLLKDMGADMAEIAKGQKQRCH